MKPSTSYCARNFKAPLELHACTGGQLCKGKCLPLPADALAERIARQRKAKNLRRRERDDAMRSLGLVKTPYGWE